MADVVGSDEGAEAAGAGAGQAEGAAAEQQTAAGNEAAAAGDQDGAPAAAENVDSAPAAGVDDAGSAAEAAPETAEEAACETPADAASQGAEAPEAGAESASADEVPDEGATAIPDGAAEPETAATDDTATETTDAETTATETTDAAGTAPVADADAAADVDAVVAEATVTVEVIAEAASVAAPPAPPPVPPVYTAAAFGAPGASAGGASDGSLFGFARRKALLIGGAAVVVIGGAVAAFAASGSSGGKQTSASGKTGAAGGKTSASASAAAVPAAAITTVPADGATGVDPSKPITVQVKGGTIESVALSGQEQTNGTLSTDRSSWTSANVLSVDAGYQLTVTAKNSAGKSTTTDVSFRTLTPSATFGVSEVVPPRGSTVGVGQPIRVTFSNYVPQEYQAALEKACVVTTSPPIAGAWYWVSNSTDGAVVDWRPQTFWPVNTKVTIDFALDGVRLGEHQFGVENYKAHNFTISDRDLRLIVDKDTFRATCYENGEVIRTFPIDTGMTTAETFVTYTGTMAVLGKGNPVEMKGNYGPGDTYDDFVNWATQITWSGTYVHAAPWDADIGYANDDSHGCVHCRTEDAEWFYGKVVAGDVVTINGSRARPVEVGNGICTFTLGWDTVLKGSAYGATLNGRPVSA